jgi:hypothetical protein
MLQYGQNNGFAMRRAFSMTAYGKIIFFNPDEVIAGSMLNNAMISHYYNSSSK